MTKPRLICALTAHVDAGKTTLSEAMLCLSGALRRAGRVDHGSAFLDTEKLEKERQKAQKAALKAQPKYRSLHYIDEDDYDELPEVKKNTDSKGSIDPSERPEIKD